jgi:uncharacterized protein
VSAELSLADWERRCAAFLRVQDATDAGHDLGHVRRVVAAAKKLAEGEGADPWVVVPAAWLHDCVVVPKDDPRRKEASRLAAEAAVGFLKAAGFPEGKLDAIAHAIEAHSFSAKGKPKTPEAAVVQDADRLDALGAVGAARCFAVSGAMGRPVVDPDDPFPDEREPDDRRSAVDHVHTKLLRLPATMTTAAGRAEAERRAAFLRVFLDQLRSELAFAP